MERILRPEVHEKLIRADMPRSASSTFFEFCYHVLGTSSSRHVKGERHAVGCLSTCLLSARDVDLTRPLPLISIVFSSFRLFHKISKLPRARLSEKGANHVRASLTTAGMFSCLTNQELVIFQSEFSLLSSICAEVRYRTPARRYNTHIKLVKHRRHKLVALQLRNMLA